MGDPIEAESIRQTFGGARRTQKLFLGSVKDNVGHTEAASGVTAVLKTILMMQKRVIPKQANFKTLNPTIPSLEQDRMSIATKSQPWRAPALTAVVNNYGAAGSNAAIILTDAKLVNKPSSQLDNPPLLPFTSSYPILLSAKSTESLRSYALALAAATRNIEDEYDDAALAQITYSLATKQNRSLDYSWTSTASSMVDLVSQLESVTLDTAQAAKTAHVTSPVVLCFSGQTGDIVYLEEDFFNSTQLLQNHMVSIGPVLEKSPCFIASERLSCIPCIQRFEQS